MPLTIYYKKTAEFYKKYDSWKYCGRTYKGIIKNLDYIELEKKKTYVKELIQKYADNIYNAWKSVLLQEKFVKEKSLIIVSVKEVICVIYLIQMIIFML